MLTISVLNGFGNHLTIIKQYDPETVIKANKYVEISVAMVAIAAALARCAGVSFLLAIQGPTGRKCRYALMTLAGLNVCFGIAHCFYILYASCDDPTALWLPNPSEKCRTHPATYGIFVGAFGAATDAILAFDPIYLLWSVPIEKKTRVGLCFLMGLGLFACAAAIVRTRETLIAKNPNDHTYTHDQLFIWTWTEMWTILIASSIPPIWPLVRTTYKKTISGATSRTASFPEGTELSSNRAARENQATAAQEASVTRSAERGHVFNRTEAVENEPIERPHDAYMTG